MTYFNTTHQVGTILEKATHKAWTQEQIIKEYYNFFGGEHTPFGIQENLEWFDVPITSVRRAMCNLTKRGFLVKTDNQIEGRYGKVNYTWKKNKFRS